MPRYPAWMKEATRGTKGYVFVGQWAASTVSAYPTQNRKNGAPVCSVGPVDASQGISVDKKGTLYVTSAFNGDKLGVATFAPNCGVAGMIYYDSDGIPSDVVADAAKLYVSNEINTGQSPPTLPVYAIGGNGNPEAELFDPTVTEGVGVAFNSNHDLFWSTKNVWSGGGQVVKFRRARMPGVVLRVTKLGSDTAGGVLVDNANNLLFIDQTTKTVNVYAPPYHARPFSRIGLKGGATFCALPPAQKELYCLDNQYGAVDVYSYPKGTYAYSWTNGIEEKEAPLGIAIQAPITRSK